MHFSFSRNVEIITRALSYLPCETKFWVLLLHTSLETSLKLKERFINVCLHASDGYSYIKWGLVAVFRHQNATALHPDALPRYSY